MIKALCPPGKNIFTGGDGAISIVVDNHKSLWLWGDSFMGEVVNNQRGDSVTNPLITGNLFVELDDEKPTTICGGTPQNPQPVIPSDSIDGFLAAYWPHHGFVENNILHVFMVRIIFDPSVWFVVDKPAYFRMSLPDYTLIDSQELASFPVNKIWYGFGFFELEGYYYTYGWTESREMHAARAQLTDDRLQGWEYFDGTNWNSDPATSHKLPGLDMRISTQFSVFPYKNKYILISQDGNSLSNNIYSFIADTPTGPWYNKKLLYTAPEPAADSRVYTYNAMAHPQYDQGNRLLIGYSVNAFIPKDVWEDASIYKPRFIRVPYDYILN